MRPILFCVFLVMNLSAWAQYRHFNAGMQSYKAKQYPQAAKEFELYVNSNPKDGNQYLYEAYYFRAVSLKQIQNYSEAIASFEKALTFGHPDKMDICWLMAMCYDELQNCAQAVDGYERALSFAKNRKDESSLLISLAQAKARCGKTNEAYRDLSAAMEKNPKNEKKITEIKRGFSEPHQQLLSATTQSQTNSKSSVSAHSNEVMRNLPKTKMKNPDAVAIVIGNSNYQNISSVDFAANDAANIKRYLVEVLGYSEGNVLLRQNISLGDFQVLFGSEHQAGKLYAICKPSSDVFVYYSGHGYPSKSEDLGYFVPVEADLNYIESSGYSLKTFYKNLSQLKVKSLTVVLDACFSGAGLMKNVSGMKPVPTGIGSLSWAVSMCSSSGAQFSSWHPEKQQGLFTYFFLKAIHNRNADSNSDGKLTFEEIFNFVSDKTRGVPSWARSLHNLEQSPQMDGGNTKGVLVVFD
jgi:tetratricopeptide (TPR) repeat protein